MQQKFYYFTTLFAILFTVQQSFAQGQQFYYEDFDGGIPDGWTTEDIAGFDAIFTWCGNPETGQSEGCPAIWNTPSNMQVPFNATTADNGFMSMDSDAIGQISGNHISLLTSAPIDASAQDEVFLRFQTHIGYFTLNVDTNAVVQVSADGINFDTYTIKAFQGLDRWSDNPANALVDISATAAGQSSVFIRWSWTGNYEYHWSIDDVELFDGDPRVANDMQVNRFFATAPNAVIPASQVEPIYFLADVENAGRNEQTGVSLNVNVVSGTGEEMFSADLDYGTIGVDSVAENQLFAQSWTPPAEPATYTVTYSISSDNADEIMDNNSVSYSFEVSETTFAKENGYTRPVTSAPGNWTNPDTDPHNIAYGNHFYIKDGTDIFVRNVSFGIGNAQEEGMTGRGLVFTLYAWFDNNSDGDAQPEERRPVGTTFYFIEGTEAPEDIITIPFPEEGDEPIELLDTTNYLMMMEYFTDDQVDIAFAASEEYDYSAMTQATIDAGAPRYSGFLGIAADLATEDYGSAGFGRDIVPVVRMEVGQDPRLDAVDEALAATNIIDIFPNPTANELNVKIDLVERADAATLRIVDVTGRLVRQMNVENLQSETLNYDIRNLTSGTYFLHFVTEAGTRTEKFTVK